MLLARCRRSGAVRRAGGRLESANCISTPKAGSLVPPVTGDNAQPTKGSGKGLIRLDAKQPASIKYGRSRCDLKGLSSFRKRNIRRARRLSRHHPNYGKKLMATKALPEPAPRLARQF